eukprot:comp59904_c0_seq1/m.47862 comp59904_c0_seq1/g.47862  ORF comp59904_c0_seq1/g.47862 comp59904_c0_seq1/m.47862 type:complete len:467 (-) comp59904_c0_seq1:45-1445(-)
MDGAERELEGMQKEGEKMEDAQDERALKAQMELQLAELKELVEKFNQKARAAEEILTKRTRDLEEERHTFEEEKRKIQKLTTLDPNDSIKLDVGGVKYRSTRSTLTNIRGTMLEAMFSGRHPVNEDEDGHVYLDADGQMFSYILSYLRHRQDDVLPGSEQKRKRLLREAEYFNIGPLIQLLQTETHHVGPRDYGVITGPIRTFGGNGRGPGLFEQPGALVVHEHCLYVADTGNRRVQKLSLQGDPLDGAIMQIPEGITDLAVGRDGKVYVAAQHKVRTYGPEGEALHCFGAAKGGARIKDLRGLAVTMIFDEIRLYLCDRGTEKVQTRKPDGQFVRQWALPGGPATIQINSRGNAVVCMPSHNCVMELDGDGAEVEKWGHRELAHSLDGPIMIALDVHDRVAVVDREGRRLRIYSPKGEYLGTVVDEGKGVVDEGKGGIERIGGVAFDRNCALYVADVNGDRVVVF